MKTLAHLLPGYFPGSSLPICSIAVDSRQVTQKGLFFAYPGYAADGRAYISQAVAKGASVVVYDNCANYLLDTSSFSDTIFLSTSNVRELVGLVAARFFDNPSQSMKVIGVTGTNGKTSITHFIAQALKRYNMDCAVLGTLGNGLLDALQPSERTTLDAIHLQKILHNYKQQQIKYVAMEVSSHALSQSRVNGMCFDTAVLSQVTRDHLDYHQNVEDYQKAKARLFSHPHLKNAVINADDTLGKELIKKHQKELSVISYSFSKPSGVEKFIYVTSLYANPAGFEVTVNGSWGQGQFLSPLLGQFNVSNLLAVIGVLLSQGLSFKEALLTCEHLQGVAGRMQSFGGGDSPRVVVDYAHTPDALEKVLQTLRIHCQNKLWCVFGCGGERDRGKRPEMGKVATTLADRVIVTNDNPRSESPEKIAEQISVGLASRIEIILDRAEAINTAVCSANKGDIVLIAGKGHEDFQIIGSEKLPFNDAQQVKAALDIND